MGLLRLTQLNGALASETPDVSWHNYGISISNLNPLFFRTITEDAVELLARTCRRVLFFFGYYQIHFLEG